MRARKVLLLALGVFIAQPSFAATVWSGPSVDITINPGAFVDTLVEGVFDDGFGVALTRISAPAGPGTGGLYNALQESISGGGASSSPLLTQWAFFDIPGIPLNVSDNFGAADANANPGLYTFNDWGTSLGGPPNLRFNIVGRPGVLHLTGPNILIDIEFTTWNSLAAAPFNFDAAYTRSSPIPIPAAFPLLLSGIAAFAFRARRRLKH